MNKTQSGRNTNATHELSFNRSEEDFNGDLRGYNDYLETREDIIYGLCSGNKDEIDQAQARVREYEDVHRGEITKNAAKKWVLDKSGAGIVHLY